MSLLGEDEAQPFTVLNPGGASRFMLTADHAGRAVPRALGDLGVAPADMDRHIAWDIGIAAVTRGLAARLDAPAILQTYSRLVIDCNRRPDVASAFPEVSEATRIPGNLGLSGQAKAARQAAIFDPYHQQITRMLDERRGRRVVYVAMHSFTPVFHGIARPMEVAVLYHRAPRFSQIVARKLRAEPGLVVAENEPYRVSDATDYGVPVHAEARGLDYLELEIRQDLIADAVGQGTWVERLARVLPAALGELERLDDAMVVP